MCFLRKEVLSLFFSGSLLFGFGSVNGQVNVTGGQTALALAQKLAGAGITIQNPTLTCPSIANGFFNVVTSNLGIDSGIVLTTGRAATSGSAYGANGSASVNASINNGAAGDLQLNTLANASTTNACILEFDMIPKGDTVKFDYVFGSEEYNTSTCGIYNDAFAFFISGPGITGQQNMALVPGTNIPVTVNTINSGIPGSQGGNIANCTSMGAGSPFTQYYVDNNGGTSITYRGFTKVLKAIHAVTPCNTYHLKMTIADAGNALFDSGVFIKAGSLKTTTFTVSSHGLVSSSTSTPYIVKGCGQGNFIIKRAQALATAQTVKYQVGGTAVNGVDYAAIADSVIIPANDTQASVVINPLVTANNGTRDVKIYVISPYSCNGLEIVDSATLTIYDGLQSKILNHDTTICNGSTFQVNVAGDPSYSYSWSPVVGLSNSNIQNPIAGPTQATTYVLTTSWPGSGCAPKADSFHVAVNPQPTVSVSGDQVLCENGDFNLMVSIQPAANYNIQWKGPDGFSATQDHINFTNAQTNASGEYVVTVLSSGCVPIKDSVKITVNAVPGAPIVVTPVAVCFNGELPVFTVSGSNHLWYSSATGGTGSGNAPVPPTNTTGSYTYYVSEINGNCEGPRSAIDVVVTHCCEDYLFVPSAFSPNGDGRNDIFHVTKGPDDKLVQLNIFNRWGQLIFSRSEGADWDGTFGGQPVEVGDYFYDVLVGCARGKLIERKGEVTVIR